MTEIQACSILKLLAEVMLENNSNESVSES